MTAVFDSAKAAGLLSETVTSVCADTAFLDASPARTPIGAQVRFEGVAIDILRPISCALEFYFTAEFGGKLADALFEEGLSSDENARDSILELLNIAAGTFLSAYCGPGADIKLELPRFLSGAPEDEGETICSIDFDAEGLPLRAVLRSIRYRY